MNAELSGYDWFFYEVVWGMRSEPPIWEPFWGVGLCFPKDTSRDELLEYSRRLLRELYVDGWAQFVLLSKRSDLASIRVEGHVMTAAEVEAEIVDSRWSEHPDVYGRWIILRPTRKTIAWQDTNGALPPRIWDEQGGWRDTSDS